MQSPRVRGVLLLVSALEDSGALDAGEHRSRFCQECHAHLANFGDTLMSLSGDGQGTARRQIFLFHRGLATTRQHCRASMVQSTCSGRSLTMPSSSESILIRRSHGMRSVVAFTLSLEGSGALLDDTKSALVVLPRLRARHSSAPGVLRCPDWVGAVSEEYQS